MKRILLACTLLVFGGSVTAESSINVTNAWVREAPPSARMLAAYMTIENSGDEERVLSAVTSPDFGHVMLHKSEVVDGVARMSHVGELAIPAQGRLELAPGSYHLMMPAPKERLTEGDQVTFELVFGDDRLSVQADVRKKP